MNPFVAGFFGTLGVLAAIGLIAFLLLCILILEGE